MAKWSRRTYETFAAMLREVEMPDRVREELAERMVSVFRADNANFRSDLFIRAALGDVSES